MLELWTAMLWYNNDLYLREYLSFLWLKPIQPVANRVSESLETLKYCSHDICVRSAPYADVYIRVTNRIC